MRLIVPFIGGRNSPRLEDTMRIKSHREVRFETRRVISYRRIDGRGVCVFGVGASGEPVAASPEAKATLAEVLSGIGVTHRQGRIEEYEERVFIPGRGECDCGAMVEFPGGDVTCHRCGAEYNSAGQLLAPRHQWGEETGEHPADVARYF